MEEISGNTGMHGSATNQNFKEQLCKITFLKEIKSVLDSDN